MYPYMIITFDYNEKGALTNIKHTYTFNDKQQFADKVAELNRTQRTVVVDEETGETVTYKAYKVEAYVAGYALIEDMAAFKAVNHIV